ncbi:MAG: ABC transporter ATP-binding protein [Methylococcales bacterium]
MALVELRQVSKCYQFGDTTITALNRIDLTIDEHEFVALWGPSGSGKTTICNLIGLLDNPSAGSIHIRQQAVSGWPDAALSTFRNESIGFVFQNFNLIPVLSAVENVMLPLRIRGVNAKQARALAEQQLDQVGLTRYYKQRPRKLSGGQQQRVAIARAMVAGPSLIIADEPTANLDTETAHKIIELMMTIHSEQGTTFIFSTHDQRLLARVKRQVLLRDGMICDDNTLSNRI